MRSLHVFLGLAIALLLMGCAADRISAPAKTIGAEISNFRDDLSRFSDDVKAQQNAEQTRIAGTVTRRDMAIAATKQLQVEWNIIRAKSEGDVFAALQQQGRDEVARLSDQPSVPPKVPAVTLPLDKLSAVASTMTQLSTPSDTKSQLEFQLNYGIAVNQQLQTIEKQAKKK